MNFDEQIALALRCVEKRNACFFHPKKLVVLSSGGDLQTDLFSIESGNVDFRAKGGLGEAHRYQTIEVIAVSFEVFVILDVHVNIQVAGNTAIGPSIALAFNPDALSIFDSSGNLNYIGVFLALGARSPATFARFLNGVAIAIAGRAGLGNTKKTTGTTNLALSLASRAHLSL